MFDLADTDKFELLKHLHKKAQKEINFLRMRQDKIFMWSSNILLLIIGALLIVKPTEPPIWTQKGSIGKIIASLAVFVLVVFSILWQQRNRKWQEESVEVLERIEYLFHCFDKGYFGTDDNALYPERWAKPRDKDKRLNLRSRIFRVNYVSATILLGLLAVAMILFS